MHRSLAVVALAVTGLFASAASGQTTRTVCASGCQYTSINAAIDDANNGDVIQLSAETYFEGEQIDTDGKAITLRGVLDKAGEPASVLDGSGTHRVLICQSGETSKTVFQDLVIQNGWSGSGGGGMFNTGSSPTLTDCTFTGNSAAEIGGGMFNTGSSPTLTNCSFEINSADYVGGGGMANQASSSPTLSDCTFTNNSADYNGGGMFNITNSSPTLNDCTFAGNSATNGYGGGMYNHRGTPPLTGCTFTSNSAERSGGGMFNLESSPPLTGCTFTSNSAERFGGGMFNLESSPTLTDCYFCGNLDDSGFTSIGGAAIDGSSSGNNLLEARCVVGDIDFDGDYDEYDVRAAMVDFGITEGTPGDMDGDDDADVTDFILLRTQIGVETLGCVVADINGDGEVDGADFAYVLGYWGLCSAP